MGTVTTLPHGQPLTRDDLDAMPDDGHRYELVDGTLIVTPAPSFRHQGVVGELHLLLRHVCPPDFHVLFAPFDVALTQDTVLQPDLLVARRAAFTARDLPAAPLLVIEVLSPSTRHVDRGLKLARYETAGCPSYWVVDPDEPALTVWELVGQEYECRARVTGRERYTSSVPYEVSIVPAELLR